MISIVFVLIIGTSLIAGLKLFKGDMSDNFKTFVSVSVGFNSLLIGIPVFSAVFTDDFKSRSLQTAIGRGMSRTKLIFTRFFEVVIILIEANVLLSIVVFVNGEVFGVKGTAITDVLNSMWVDSTTIVCYFAVAMIFVYWKQNGTLGLVLYILMSLNAFNLALVGINQIPFLKKNDIDLTELVVEGMKESILNADKSAEARILWAVAMVSIYIVLPLLITVRIFRRRELEF